MEKKKWITTEQMLKELRLDPNKIKLYELRLTPWLLSEHRLVYDSLKRLFGDSTALDAWGWYTEAHFLRMHAGEFWCIIE